MEPNEIPFGEQPNTSVDLILSDDAVINNIITPIVRLEKHLSFSSLSQFAETPRDFIKYKMKTMEVTEAMIFGAMMHCLVLEPDDFGSRYMVIDDEEECKRIGGAKPRATAAYKTWFALQQQNAGDKQLVKQADFRKASNMANDIRYNPAARRVLDICPGREVPVEWDYGNFKWKGYKDGNGDYAVCDVKKVTDANPRKVKWTIIDMRYYLQAAMYLKADALLAGKEDWRSVFDKDYYVIAVDDNNGISVHQMDKTLIERGLKEYDYLIGRFSECIIKDRFDASYEFYADRWDGIYDLKQGW